MRAHRPSPLALVASFVVLTTGVPAVGAQTDPSAPPPPGPTTPSIPGTPTTAKPTAPSRPTAGRRALPKDPALLAADGRNRSGVIVTTSPALDGVEVTSKRYDGAAQQRDADAADLADANHRIETTTAHLARLEADRAALVGLIARSTAREHKLDRTAERLAESVRAVAVRRFIHSSSADLFPDPHATVEEALTRSHERRIAGEAEREVEAKHEAVGAELAETTTAIGELERLQESNESDTAEVTRELTRARSDAEIATAALVAAEKELRSERPMTAVAGSDLPTVALDAYWRAANDLRETRPSCGLTWWALAGVGRSESNHGRSGGGQPGPDGTTTVPVFGPPLDGTNGTRLIVDSDEGSLDLDPELDRAVGVMQFLPGTWKRWAEDQSGDRKSDPQNIYDAALASGKLLCSAASGLDTDDGLRKAYFAYNRSEDYVEKVLALAHSYEALPIPSGEPEPEPDPGPAPEAPVTATER